MSKYFKNLQFHETKEAKKLKNQARICACASVAGMLLTATGCCLLFFPTEKHEIVKNAGYYEFNENYRQETILKANEDFANGVISEGEHKLKINNVKDYGEEKYMKDYASETELAEYNNEIKKEKINISVGCISAFAGIVGTAAGFCIGKEKEDRYREESTNTIVL